MIRSVGQNRVVISAGQKSRCSYKGANKTVTCMGILQRATIYGQLKPFASLAMSHYGTSVKNMHHLK
jgi:hypothetical protein